MTPDNTRFYTMIKLQEYKLRQYGMRALQLSIPKVYSKDNNLKHSDVVTIFRTIVNGVDGLFIVPASNSDKIEQTNGTKNV